LAERKVAVKGSRSELGDRLGKGTEGRARGRREVTGRLSRR
jgi:hypothetical protein